MDSLTPANVGPGHHCAQGSRVECPTQRAAFVKYGRGRVFYRRQDIEEWWARQVRTSTADAAPAQAQD